MKSIFVRIQLIPTVVFVLLSFFFYVRYVKNGLITLDDFLFFSAGSALVLIAISFALTYRTTVRMIRPLRELIQLLREPPTSEWFPEGLAGFSRVDEINEIQRQTYAYLGRMREHLRDLNLERELLRSLLNGLQEGVICADSAGTILFINERVDESLLDGRSTSDRYFFRLRHPVLLEYVNRLLNDMLYEKAGGESRPVQIFDAVSLENGDLEFRSGEKYFRLRHRPVHGTEDPVLYVIIIQDVTEEYNTRRLREDFLQNASHELKTPITSIRGYAETLVPRVHEPVQQRFLEGILRNAERMDRLIHDMVIISSLESRAFPFSPESIDLRRFFDELELLIEGTLKQKNQILKIQRDDSVGPITADRLLLEHLFVNLVGNASRYSPENSKIIIKLHPVERNRIEIRVMDEGPGIPEEFREKIFERFFRMDQDRSRKEGGTGLGLSIVRHVVRLHSGSIRVEDGPNGGACFVVVLPAH